MKKILLLCFCLILALAVTATAAEVRVTWDHNNPLPDGYRIFLTYTGQFDYTAPVWQGTENMTAITVDTNRLFQVVCRAYVGNFESEDSNVVTHAVVSKVENVGVTFLRDGN